jgi:hypothetical protein
VEINGTRTVIVRPEDWDQGTAWQHATARPFAAVNELLGNANATVRAFRLYAGGNKGPCLLLDPGVVVAMEHSGLFSRYDIPELPA